jgi:hypothetical protein
MENRLNWNGKISYGGPERRVYKRIRKHFIAKFQSRPRDAQERTSANWDMVTIYNLGAGGALFNYNRRLEIGSLLNLEVKFPQSETPIRGIVKIIRVEEPSKALILHIAATFIEIDKKQKETINKAAEGFYSRRPGLLEP